MYNPNLSCLLMLPPPPVPLTPAALKAAYHPSVTATLAKLASLKLSKPAILEIVLPCSGINNLEEPRPHLFEKVEHLLASLYALICIVCAQNSIEPNGAGGIDARVLLLAYDEPGLSLDNQEHSFLLPVSGPIIDLHTLALTRRNWNYIFCTDNEQGQKISNRYLDLAGLRDPAIQAKIHRVQGGMSLSSTVTPTAQVSKGSPTIHTTVAVGGTFDHLHAGHKLLLTATALLLQPVTCLTRPTRRLIVGITGDNLLRNKKYAEYLQSWKQRQEDVVDFLLTILSFTPLEKEELETFSFDEPIANGRAVHTRLKQVEITIECVEIQDPFGPTITDETVTALVVSGETRSGGAAVNAKRKEKGWKALEIFEVDVLDSEEDKQHIAGTEEFAAKISSTAIRKRKAETAHGLSP